MNEEKNNFYSLLFCGFMTILTSGAILRLSNNLFDTKYCATICGSLCTQPFLSFSFQLSHLVLLRRNIDVSIRDAKIGGSTSGREWRILTVPLLQREKGRFN